MSEPSTAGRLAVEAGDIWYRSATESKQLRREEVPDLGLDLHELREREARRRQLVRVASAP